MIKKILYIFCAFPGPWWFAHERVTHTHILEEKINRKTWISAAAMIILKTKGFGKKMTFFIERNRSNHSKTNATPLFYYLFFIQSLIKASIMSYEKYKPYSLFRGIFNPLDTHIYKNKHKSRLRICFFVFSAFIAVLLNSMFSFLRKKNKKSCLI